jgi:hypothetical protein
MQKDFEAHLKLEEGVEGVRKLMTYEQLSNVFADGVQERHFNIVVKRPATGESDISLATAILTILSPGSSICLTSF